MSRIISFPYFASLAIFLSLVSPAIADGPFFMGLGQIEGYDGWGSFAQAISGDGHVVIGSSQEGSDLAMAFRWTLEEGMVPLGFLPGGDSSFAYGVSEDGSVIVGSSKSYNTNEDGEWEAFRWTADTGMVGLGDLPGSYFRSRAYDVTADGATVVGHGTKSEVVAVEHAVRWVGEGPPEDLGGMPGVIPQMSKSGATAVSPDGSVIVGWAWNASYSQEACIWTEGQPLIGLGDLDEYAVRPSIAWDVANETELTVVGRSYISGADYEAFRWTEATGMVGIGTLFGPSSGSTAYAVTPDGSVIVGGSGSHAFIWGADDGMRNLEEVLTNEYGLDLTGWSRLSSAHGISDDGLTIVGGGFHNGLGEAWIAHIPEPAAGLLLLLGSVLFMNRPRTARGRERTSNVMTGFPFLRFRAATLTALVGIVALSVATPVEADAPFFTGLGHIEGYEWASKAHAISSDGSTVVGASSTQSEGSVAFRWTLEQGLVPLGFLPGGDSSGAHGVSADGSVIVGWGKSYNTTEDLDWEAFKWTADTGMVGLGDLPGSYFRSRAYDVTADGETVVGHGTKSEVVAVRHAVRWVGDGPPEDLGGMPGVIPQMSNSSATAVSADGSVIVGWAWNASYSQEACIWTEGQPLIGLGTLGGYGSESIAWDVAVTTETIVVGENRYYGGDYEAFRWTPETGMVGLGDLPGGLCWSEAHAVSADGNVIVGSSSGDPGGAFIWDPDHGMRSLQQLLTSEYGFDLTEWSSLVTAYGISADGLTIVGAGFRNGVHEAWVAHIPEPRSLTLLLMGSILGISRRGGAFR